MTRTDKEHLVRTVAVVVLFLACGAAWMFGDLDTEMKAQVSGLLLLLGVAVPDVLQLATRQAKARKAAAPKGDS